MARGYGHVHRRLRAGARPGGEADPDIVAGVQAFAGGPLLAMLADTMLPEAYQDAGKLTGLVTVLGFALAFFLARLG